MAGTRIAFRHAWRMLRNEQDARDAAQDTMVKVLRNLDRYDDQYKFTTWLLRITRNTCIDRIRKQKRRAFDEIGDVVDGRPGPLHEVIARDNARHVRAALQELPPLYREVLTLYHDQGLKYREIAELLDIPNGTVMNRIFRARRKVAALLPDDLLAT
jgi:RNA polymerase sigma-70 factor (ECF subfamily)